MKGLKSLKILDEFESILSMHNFPSLLERSQIARQKIEWNEIEKFSIEILRALFEGKVIPEESMKIVTKNYLSSLNGTAEILTESSDEPMEMYAFGVQKVFNSQQNHIELQRDDTKVTKSVRIIKCLKICPKW